MESCKAASKAASFCIASMQLNRLFVPKVAIEYHNNPCGYYHPQSWVSRIEINTEVSFLESFFSFVKQWLQHAVALCWYRDLDLATRVIMTLVCSSYYTHAVYILTTKLSDLQDSEPQILEMLRRYIHTSHNSARM